MRGDVASPLLNLIMRTCLGDELDAFLGSGHLLRVSSLDLEQPLGRAVGSRPIKLK